MRRSFTAILAGYWAIFFALMTLAPLTGGHGTALHTLFTAKYVNDFSGMPQAPSAVSILFALAFGLVCALFIWFAAAAVFRDPDDEIGLAEISETAFSSATGVMVVCLFAAAFYPVSGLYPAVSAHIAALAATYVATLADEYSRKRIRELRERDAVSKAARMRALGAVHDATVSRAANRNSASRTGWRR